MLNTVQYDKNTVLFFNIDSSTGLQMQCTWSKQKKEISSIENHPLLLLPRPARRIVMGRLAEDPLSSSSSSATPTDIQVRSNSSPKDPPPPIVAGLYCSSGV